MPGTGAEIPATSAMFMHEPSRTLDTLVPCFRFQKFGEAIPYEITVSEFFARYLSITPDAAIDAHHEHRFIRFLVVMVFPMTRNRMNRCSWWASMAASGVMERYLAKNSDTVIS